MTSEEEKAARLREYDRLSALSRKKSKAAAQTLIRANKNDLSQNQNDHTAKPPSGVVG
jgi:hypothetical protein